MHPMTSDMLAALDPEQRAVAEAMDGPVCVMAGAGTGKTRAITHRIAHQVTNDVVVPSQVLAVTFTTRAAGELRSRLRTLGAGGVQARTFHSAALRQLGYFWPRLSDGPRPTIVASKLPAVRAAAGRRRLSLSVAEARDIATEIEWAKSALVAPERYVAAAAGAGRLPPLPLETVESIFRTYEEVNTSRNQIDFEDLLLLAAGAIEEHPAIAGEVRGQYRHFTVDEYQDVSPLQQRLLDAWLGDRSDLCVVGDPNQTIYSFSGASPSYLTGFAARFPDATVVRLVRDYRSTEQVVALANRLTPGTRLVAQGGDGPIPRVSSYDDEPAEAAAVAAAAAALHAQGVAWAEMAVLFRINAQSEVYEAALADAGAPYVLRGGERFFERAEIREAMVLLRGALRSAPDDDLGQHVPLAEIVTDVLAGRGLTPQPPEGGGAARDRWEALRSLVTLAEDLSATQPGAGLQEFCEELAERADAQHAPTVDGVTLASLHAAKGLEWDAVWLVGLADGTLPIQHATTPEQIEEERRLLYVGITRARRHLSLSWAAARAAGGRRRRSTSRFLVDAGLAGAPDRPSGRRERRGGGGSDLDLDDPLVVRLREWRSKQAAEIGVPAYVVFDNKTLAAIVAAQPTSMAELGAVPGIGPKKLTDYGVDLLTMLTGD
jgi:DNA helicase-2/ATP-dependent DNA helicase PcrA